MMMVRQLIPAAGAILLCAVVFWLIRRDRLAGRIAAGWVALAIGMAVLGLFPGLIGWPAHKLGIVYPFALAAVGAGVVVAKLLAIDMERSRTRQQIRLLAQKVAVLEAQHRSSSGEHPDKD